MAEESSLRQAGGPWLWQARENLLLWHGVYCGKGTLTVASKGNLAVVGGLL